MTNDSFGIILIDDFKKIDISFKVSINIKFSKAVKENIPEFNDQLEYKITKAPDILRLKKNEKLKMIKVILLKLKYVVIRTN